MTKDETLAKATAAQHRKYDNLTRQIDQATGRIRITREQRLSRGERLQSAAEQRATSRRLDLMSQRQDLLREIADQ